MAFRREGSGGVVQRGADVDRQRRRRVRVARRVLGRAEDLTTRSDKDGNKAKRESLSGGKDNGNKRDEENKKIRRDSFSRKR